MNPDLQSKFLGCLLGGALGDALGELAFRYPDKAALAKAAADAEVLRYTDDTAMTLGVAESLARRGTVDQEDLGRTFHRNFLSEPWRGYASGPPTVFQMVQGMGISYVQAARRLFGGAGSFGNGAAMRVAPVSLFFRHSPDLYEQAAASAAVTHAHPLGQDGAAVQARAVAQAVNLDPQKPFKWEIFLKEVQSFARTAALQEKLRLLEELLSRGTPARDAAPILGRSVAVDESLPFALYAFLSHPHSYEDCLFCAILHGGDRDTLGAMAGTVSGAFLGREAISRPWLEKLENRQQIEQAALALFLRST